MLAVFEVHVARIPARPHRRGADLGRGVPVTLRLLVILSLKPLITANLVSRQFPLPVIFKWTVWTLMVVRRPLQLPLHPVFIVHVEENLLGDLGLEVTEVTPVDKVPHVRGLHMVL